MTKAEPSAVLREHAIPVLATLLRESCRLAERWLKKGAVQEALAVAAEAEYARTKDEDSEAAKRKAEDAEYRKKAAELDAEKYYGYACQHGMDVARMTTALTAAVRAVREDQS